MASKPMFIVFEGIDGCGKSTQAELLVTFLQKTKRPTRLIHFPNYTSATGRQIARHLRGEKKASPEQMAVLYAKDKYEGAGQIRKLLSSGFNVVVDRYTASNCAYQSARIKGTALQKGKFIEWVLRLEALLPQPDATFIIDVNPAIAFQKNLQKKGRAYLKDKKDVYEKDVDFQKAVRTQYLAYAKICKSKGAFVINAMNGRKMASKEAVASKVLSALSNALQGSKPAKPPKSAKPKRK